MVYNCIFMGPFTQSINIGISFSSNANTVQWMGTISIAANANANANALCERTLRVTTLAFPTNRVIHRVSKLTYRYRSC